MEKSIEILNKAAADKLSAIHQYFYFHFHFDDQGHSMLADLFKKTAAEEVDQLERLAQRILFLKGDIILTRSQRVHPIKVLDEMLSFATEMEARSKGNCRKWAKKCLRLNDTQSADLLTELALEEKKHQEQFLAEVRTEREVESDYCAIC